MDNVEETVETVDVELQEGLKRPKIFMVLKSKDIEELELEIAKALLDGYVLHFGTILDKGTWYQPMVNEELLRRAKQLGVK